LHCRPPTSPPRALSAAALRSGSQAAIRRECAGATRH